jgi:hypothetical protein
MGNAKQNEAELYVTTVEQEAYDLGGQLALANVRSHVAEWVTDHGDRFYYVVMVDAPEAMDRARAVRKKMFGS